MRIENINEPVSVLASFSGGACQPLRFRWHGRTYKVDAVNGRWIDRGPDGDSLHYSVQAGDETYYLHFAQKDVQWWLDQLMAE